MSFVNTDSEHVAFLPACITINTYCLIVATHWDAQSASAGFEKTWFSNTTVAMCGS